MVATSATRDARNRADFIGGVREILGVEPEVITGEEEAALSFAGATGDLRGRPDLAEPYLVVDIGGGSTEFVLGGPRGRRASRSVDIGCVRHDRTAPAQRSAGAASWRAAEADIATAIADAASAVDLAAARTLVAVAGTATTVTALALGLPEYDADRIHLSAISLAGRRADLRSLASMDPGSVRRSGRCILAGST